MGLVKFQAEAAKRHWAVVSVLHFTAVERPNTIEVTPQLQIIKDSGRGGHGLTSNRPNHANRPFGQIDLAN